MIRHIDVLSIFPEMFKALDSGITGRALKQELLSLGLINPRDFSENKHRNVDDRPYGGGPGMLMAYQPLKLAIEHAKRQGQVANSSAAGNEAQRQLKKPPIKSGQKDKKQPCVIYLSPQGKQLNQKAVKELFEYEHLILLCGRYEGVDERLIESHVDQEWSIGDYVLSGGELPAMVLIDALVRLIPGALGHNESALKDSFFQGLLDHPHYTRPELIDDKSVPEVLLSGDHKAIDDWRAVQSIRRTLERRPDLLAALDLDDKQQKILDELLSKK